MARTTHILLTFFILLTHLVLIIATKPDLSVPTPVVTVKELENRQIPLTSDISCSDSDGNLTRVYRKSISPNTPCGSCFPIWPCNPGYCLMYVPTLGKMEYNVAPSYVISLACTNDIEPEDVKTIEVRLIANTPPVFTNPPKSYETTTITKTQTKRSGDLIYDVNADDVDGDAVYYTMSMDPTSRNFEIAYGGGAITATRDLRFQCDPEVNFYVKANDEHNSPVGPVVIDVTFNGYNVRPVATNLDTTVKIAENTGTGTTAHTINVVDGDVFNSLQYRVKATPEQGLDLYELVDNKIVVRRLLNYEYPDLRTVTLTIDISDGFCNAQTHVLTLEITDVPEPPVLKPDFADITVYEGFLTIDPGWTLVDPDENEVHKWTKTGSTTFSIDSDSGLIISASEVDVDPDRTSITYRPVVTVTDKDGLKTTGTVTITVLDKNDNPPIFKPILYEFSASECTPAGAELGTVKATDIDSSFQGNDILVYSGRSLNMTVLVDGTVHLNSQCTAGSTDSVLAQVTDQGLYPGPLTGVPATVTLKCNPCPTPPPPKTTTIISTPVVATTTKRSNLTIGQAGSNKSDFFTGNMGWIVPAAILAALLLGILAYVIWRYCTRACSNWSNRRALMKKSPKSKTAPPKAVKLKKENKIRDPPPTPPAPPPPDKEPELFGFWKEAYVDRDEKHMPNRNAIPASVAQDNIIAETEKAEEMKERKEREKERQQREEKYKKELQEYYKKAQARNNPDAVSDKPAKKKLCIIL